MEVKQIYDIINDVTNEVIGASAIISEDLSNIVDIGTAVANANAYDVFTQALVNRIGKTIFVNRPYRGRVPSILRDGWEFGSVLQKVSGAGLIEGEENETWELTDNTSYDPNIFYKPTVTVKFFNKTVTFELPQSIAIRQVKQSLTSPTELNGFLSMLYNEVDKSLTVKIDALVMRCINNLIAETIIDDYASTSFNFTAKTGTKAINLLYMYNQTHSTKLTAANAITDPDFLRFAAYQMGVVATRLKVINENYNVGGMPRFTPTDLLHVVMLEDFSQGANVYLYSDTFHNDFVKLPTAETVPYWQGTGTNNYAFTDISSIKVKSASGVDVTASGILAIMFDHDAAAVCLEERYTTSQVNNKAEFVNNWHKFKAEYINDLNEQVVVFFVA